MPKVVAVAEVPTFTRQAATKPYDPALVFLTDLLGDAKRRLAEGVLFTQADDGYTDESQPAFLSACRLTAKQLGRRIAVVLKPEGIYIKDNGEFVPLSPAEVEKRKAVREANAHARNLQEEAARKAAAKAGK